MDTKQALEAGLNIAQQIVTTYLADLPDTWWNQSPHPDCQTLNWQYGHLILSESQMIATSLQQTSVLPAGFSEIYAKPASTLAAMSEPDQEVSRLQQLSPSQLRQIYQQQRSQTLSLLQDLNAEQLDHPTPESIRKYCPTVGDAFVLTGAHWLMHSGQWVILRRMAGLPVVL